MAYYKERSTLEEEARSARVPFQTQSSGKAPAEGDRSQGCEEPVLSKEGRWPAADSRYANALRLREVEKLAQGHKVSSQTSHRPGALVPPPAKGSHGPSGHMRCRGQAGVRGWALLLCLLSRPADTCKVRNFWGCGGGRRLEQTGSLRVDPRRPPRQPLGQSLTLPAWGSECVGS